MRVDPDRNRGEILEYGTGWYFVSTWRNHKPGNPLHIGPYPTREAAAAAMKQDTKSKPREETK